MSHIFTTEPGNWHAILTDVFGRGWKAEERDLYANLGPDSYRKTTKVFTYDKGEEWRPLCFIRPELEIGQRVHYPTRVGYCCEHSERGVWEVLAGEPLNEGITGTIVRLGMERLPLSWTQAHVVVQLDPATVRGRHAWRVCLPPTPLRIITEAQSEALAFGGLFA